MLRGDAVVTLHAHHQADEGAAFTRSVRELVDEDLEVLYVVHRHGGRVENHADFRELDAGAVARLVDLGFLLRRGGRVQLTGWGDVLVGSAAPDEPSVFRELRGILDFD